MQKEIRLEKLKIYPYLFLLPVLVILITYLAYPIINTLQISLYDWSGLIPFRDAVFTGFKNYKNLMDDRIFWIAVKNLQKENSSCLPQVFLICYSYLTIMVNDKI